MLNERLNLLGLDIDDFIEGREIALHKRLARFSQCWFALYFEKRDSRMLEIMDLEPDISRPFAYLRTYNGDLIRMLGRSTFIGNSWVCPKCKERCSDGLVIRHWIEQCDELAWPSSLDDGDSANRYRVLGFRNLKSPGVDMELYRGCLDVLLQKQEVWRASSHKFSEGELGFENVPAFNAFGKPLFHRAFEDLSTPFRDFRTSEAFEAVRNDFRGETLVDDRRITRCRWSDADLSVLVEFVRRGDGQLADHIGLIHERLPARNLRSIRQFIQQMISQIRPFGIEARKRFLEMLGEGNDHLLDCYLSKCFVWTDESLTILCVSLTEHGLNDVSTVVKEVSEALRVPAEKVRRKINRTTWVVDGDTISFRRANLRPAN